MHLAMRPTSCTIGQVHLLVQDKAMSLKARELASEWILGIYMLELVLIDGLMILYPRFSTRSPTRFQILSMACLDFKSQITKTFTNSINSCQH